MTDGSVAIIESGGRILLHQRDYQTISHPGYWQLFGGHSNNGEYPMETLLRELEEELTRIFAKTDFKFIRSFPRIEKPTGTIYLYYHQGDYTVNDFTLGEGLAMAFVNPEYLNRLKVCPDMENIFKQIYGGGR